MVEYGVPAGKASTTVARSQAVRGWGSACHGRQCIQVSWVPLSLTHWLQRLASFRRPVPRALSLEVRAYMIWGVFWLGEEVPWAD